MAKVQVSLSLPKMTFTSPTVSLGPELQAMGMVQAFEQDSADFTGMCSTPPDGEKLLVADVLQKAMVEMKETGVEAAAATSVTVCSNCLAAIETETVNVNRPYLFAIVDDPTGAIVFLGHAEDPTDWGSPSHGGVSTGIALRAWLQRFSPR
jgi:serpin B